MAIPAGSRTRVGSGVHALTLTGVPCQPTSKLAQAAGTRAGGVVVEGMHDSPETILSLFYYLACGQHWRPT